MKIKSQEKIMHAVANYLQAALLTPPHSIGDGIDALVPPPNKALEMLHRVHTEVREDEFGQ
jgi:hypothetical protein